MNVLDKGFPDGQKQMFAFL